MAGGLELELPPAGSSTVRAMHTHFASATAFLATVVYVLLGLTLWRLVWMHGLTSSNKTVAGLSRAAMFQA